jgi:hypothetical protein
MAVAAAGCTPDPSLHEEYVGCSVDADCEGNLVCIRGFCVVDVDEDSGSCLVGNDVIPHRATVDCYTGPADTEGVGRCRGGEQECVNGVLTSCLGQVLPRVETCNGRDDDCDGVVDNIDDVACDTGLFGRCMEGRLVCRGSLAACEPLHEPRDEMCNGLDDDCDGEVDNDVYAPCYPEGLSGCEQVSDGTFQCMGVCRAGTAECKDGEFDFESCEGYVLPQEETEETCGDGLDQSCSGMPDDGCPCDDIGGLYPCYTGTAETRNEGACRDGAQVCLEGPAGDGVLGPCESHNEDNPQSDDYFPLITPEPETCANMDPSWEPGADPATLDPQFDNDCNGVVDDVPNLGRSCTDDEALGVCRHGTWWCDLDEALLVCETPAPLEEDVCDGSDRNCDGTVDTGFDLLTDNENCGECGNECNNGLQCCQGGCMNLQTSDDACGDCETTCGEGRTCCGGSCVDTQRNNDHCGTCGERCGDGRTCCGGSCVDTRSSTDHCGVCGESCGGGQACCDGTCAAPDDPLCTGCPMTCPSGTECCDGSCVNLQTDSSHCGRCGDGCGSNQICCGGDCVSSSSTSHCGSCSEQCDPGQLCCGGSCVNSNSANCGSCGHECGQNEICCGDMCVSSHEEPNCGACGVTCMGGEACSRGRCCSAGWTNCGGTCVNTSTNVNHCGDCGRSCGAQQACVGGCCCRGQSCDCL